MTDANSIGLPLAAAQRPNPYLQAPSWPLPTVQTQPALMPTAVPTILPQEIPQIPAAGAFTQEPALPLSGPAQADKTDTVSLSTLVEETPKLAPTLNASFPTADQLSWQNRLRLWLFQKRNSYSVGLLRTNDAVKRVALLETERLSGRYYREGVLYTKDGDPVAHVTAAGRLTLKDQPGRTYDLFNNPFLQVDYAALSKNSMLGEQLFEGVVTRAVQNDFAPWLHREIEATGKGVGIRIIDYDRNHATMVESIINGGGEQIQTGIAPDTSVDITFFRQVKPKLASNPSEADLKQFIIEDFTNDIDAIALKLEEQVRQAGEAQASGQAFPRILNISIGNSRAWMYHEMHAQVLPRIMDDLKASYTKGNLQNPLIREIVEADAAKQPLRKYDALIRLVDSILDASPEVVQSLERYQNAVNQAEDKGLILVIAAGNEQDEMPLGLEMKYNAFINYLGKSHKVILVAGSHANETPQVIADDQVTTFSNWGTGRTPDSDGHTWNPITAAPANLVLAYQKEAWGSPVLSVTMGTSFAAPWVAGIIALMLEVNPSLTPSAVRTILTMASENPDNTPLAAVGHGFLNPLTAVKLAKQLPEGISS